MGQFESIPTISYESADNDTKNGIHTHFRLLFTYIRQNNTIASDVGFIVRASELSKPISVWFNTRMVYLEEPNSDVIYNLFKTLIAETLPYTSHSVVQVRYETNCAFKYDLLVLYDTSAS